MKRFLLCALFLSVMCLAAPYSLQAKIVTVTIDFEEFADLIGPNSAWCSGEAGRPNSKDFPTDFGTSTTVTGPYGTPVRQTSFVSQGVTFFMNRDMSYGSWTGTGLSTYNSYLNEMASMTGSGNGGSSVYGVIYGDSADGLPYDSALLPRIILPDGGDIVSMAITNTVYTAYTMGNIDPNGFAKPGGYMDLYIYGVDPLGELVGKVVQSLGSDYDILTDWTTVDLSGLAGASELRFAFASDDILNHSGYSWLNYPVYFAFDDIVYQYDDGIDETVTPEPASLAIILAGIGGLWPSYRRFRRK